MRKSLNKNERLKSRKQIEFLFRSGQRFNVSLLRVFYVISETETNEGRIRLQFGVGASSRVFKKAVDRNRIKRLGRESWRLQKHILEAMPGKQKMQLAVFFIYTGKELPDYRQMYAATTEAIQKLLARIK